MVATACTRWSHIHVRTRAASLAPPAPEPPPGSLRRDPHRRTRGAIPNRRTRGGVTSKSIPSCSPPTAAPARWRRVRGAAARPQLLQLRLTRRRKGRGRTRGARGGGQWRTMHVRQKKLEGDRGYITEYISEPIQSLLDPIFCCLILFLPN